MTPLTPRPAHALQRKLLLPLLLIGGCVAAASVWGIHAVTQKHLVAKLRQRAELLANAVNYTAEGVAHQKVLQRIVSAFGAEREVTLIAVVGGTPSRVLACTRTAWLGKTLPELPLRAVAEDLAEAIRTQQDHSRRHDDTLELDFTTPNLVSEPYLDDPTLAKGAVMVRLDLRPTLAEITSSSTRFAGTFLAILASLTVLGYLQLNRHVLQPIAVLGRYIKDRAGADSQIGPLENRDDEFGNLGRTLHDAFTRTEAAVRELKQQQIELQVLFDLVPAMIWVKDTQNGFLRVNKRVVDVTGMTMEQIVGKSAQELFPNEAAAYYADDLEVIHSGVPKIGIVGKLRVPTGEDLWVRTDKVPFCDPDGKVTGLVAMVYDVTAAQEAAEALRESEARFRGTFEQAAVGIAHLSAEGRFLRVNDKLCSMVGYERDELLSPAFAGLTLPEERAAAHAARLSMITGEKPSFRIEKRYRRKDGEVIWVNLVTTLERDSAGEPQYFISVYEDITERKRMEDALRESKERFAGAFEHAPIGVALVSPEGRWLQVNRALCVSLGYSEEDLLTRTFQDITHPEDLEADLEFARQVIAGKIRSYQMEKRYVHQRGHLITVLLHVSLVRNGQGEPLYFIAQIQDITERKRMEEALRASVEEFRVLAEAMPQIVWVTRPDGWHTHFNQRWFDYTGLTLQESLGHGWLPPFHPEDQPIAARRWKHSNDTGEPYQIEYRLRGADGNYRWMLGRALPLRDEAGTIVKWFGTCTDIHDLKLAEQRIQRFNAELEEQVAVRTKEFIAAAAEAERASRAKSEFLGRTSHELRTPLNAILGFGQLLELEEGLGEEPRECVQEILQAGRHLLSLVNDVLDISNAESGGMSLTLEPVPVDPLITETLSIARSLERTLKVDVERVPPLDRGWKVLADPQRLKQVLFNLLSNAVKYNRPGGKVVVEYAPTTEADPPAFRFSVQDTGPGISPEKLPRLFTPFDRLDAECTRSHISGTGLGLSLSRRMVELMGGRIGVESVVGEGSTFWVEVPLAERPALSGADNGKKT